MKKLLCIALALVLCAAAIVSSLAETTREEAQAIADSVTNTTTDKSQVTSPFISVISSVQTSVVGVNNYQNYTYYSSGYGYGFSYGGRGKNTETVEKLAATGSGVVVYDHLVLTNFHVIEDSIRLTVSVLNDETEYAATLVNYDEAADVAVLYVPDLEVAPVALGDSDALQVGEWAICIGNPLSDELRGTVTTGIISALDRAISSTTTTDKYGLKSTVVNTMIQTDAAINSGNSGGGMFNILGQLVGIPSMKLSTSGYTSTASIEGIGFAIPINTAKPLINEAIVMILTGSTGTTADTLEPGNNNNSQSNSDKPTLGITVSAITNSNNYYVYNGYLPSGILISEITENSPAATYGLQPYDIIVEADGVLTTSVNALRDVLSSHSYDDVITVKVYRVEGLAEATSASDLNNGEYIDLTVTLFAYNTAA